MYGEEANQKQQWTNDNFRSQKASFDLQLFHQAKAIVYPERVPSDGMEGYFKHHGQGLERAAGF